MSIRRSVSGIPKVADPFANDAPWTLYEVCKTIAVGITLFPVRALLLLALIAFDFLVAKCATVGMTLTDEGGCLRHEEPLLGWRRALLWVIWVTNRVQLWCLGFWTVEIEDRRTDGLHRANLLVAAPHTCIADVYLVAHAFPPCPSGLGKADLARLPLLSAKAIAAQSVFLDRGDRGSREACRRAIAGRAGPSWRGGPLLVFPEGTTTNGRVLVRFRLGAFLPGEAVQPLTLGYPHRHHDPSWVGRNSHMLVAALRMMCQVYNRGRVTIFETYTPSAAECADPGIFAANVRTLMAESLGVYTTEHTYGDVYLSVRCAEANVGSDFEAESIMRLYGFDNVVLLALLKTFRAFGTHHHGAITRSEFCHVLGLVAECEWGVRTAASVDNLFTFFDIDRAGALSFRGFVQLAALLAGKGSLSSRVGFAFLVYDLEGVGRVSTDLLRAALGSYASRDGGSRGAPCDADAPLGEEEEEKVVLPGMEKRELSFSEFEALATKCPEVIQRVTEATENHVLQWLPNGWRTTHKKVE